jgi:hypothetical protein
MIGAILHILAAFWTIATAIIVKVCFDVMLDYWRERDWLGVKVSGAFILVLIAAAAVVWQVLL